MKLAAVATRATPVRAEACVFNRWALVYDVQDNPMLALEERHVVALLPKIAGGHMLDFGCGTGRWLTRLEALKPTDLHGVDCSEAMLQRAREKALPTTKLEIADSSSLPLKEASCSFVMASFVLSYIEDLAEFARECARVLSTGGQMLISDMHPTTSTERGWKRSFHVAEEKIEIAISSRSLAETIDSFHQVGFETEALVEPPFEEAERMVFETAGKLAEYEEMAGVPAIYILSLRKRGEHAAAIPQVSPLTLQLVNCRWSADEDTWNDGALLLENGRITNVDSSADADAQTIDLDGYSLLPGLINAHDHLEFGLFPRLGRTVEDAPYRNATEWASEIHQIHAEVIERYRRIPLKTRIRWGGIRNLLCGVTTVCHHNPMYDDLTNSDFPVRVVTGFGWAHSLAFDREVAAKHQSTAKDLPFIIHAAEGVDDSSRYEISQLNQMRVLDERTVVVHGLACTATEIELLKQRGVSLVVCPTSNRFLFGFAHSQEQLASIERLALGSDSSITAAGDLLDEVRYLRVETRLNPEAIYRMVTTSAAAALRLKNGEGRIAESGLADLIAVRETNGTPSAVLANLSMGDVELVLLAGRVQMASPQVYERLSNDLRCGMELIEVEGHQRWIRYPVKDLFDSAAWLLGEDEIKLAGKKVRYLGTL